MTATHHIDDLTEVTLSLDPETGLTAHADPGCERIGTAIKTDTPAEASSAGAWVCSECVDVSSAFRAPHTPHATRRDDSVDAPERTGSGGGGGSHSTGVLATDRQIAFLRKLAEERPTLAAAHVPADLSALTKLDASNIIDVLKSAPKEVVSVPTEHRWRKAAGEWVVVGPPASVGDTITIHKANGTTTEAVVASVRPDGAFTVTRGGTGTAKPKSGITIEEGRFYTLTDGRILRVKRAKTTGNLYGQVWDGVEWEYVGAKLFPEADHLVTAAEAKAFGISTSRCVFCSLALTDERSTEVGYGPVCAKNHGLPWGAS